MSDLLEVSPECVCQSPAAPNTAQQAIEAARCYCRQNPGWLPIYVFPNGTTHLYKTWEELTPRQKREFTKRLKPTEYARFWYEEYGPHICKVPQGWIIPDGNFSHDYRDNACMVFKLAVSDPLVQLFLLSNLAWTIAQNQEALKYGSYGLDFKPIPQALRSGVVWWNRGRGWRLRKDWRAALIERLDVCIDRLVIANYFSKSNTQSGLSMLDDQLTWLTTPDPADAGDKQ